MKFIWFHMQGYRELPKDFEDCYESVRATPPTDELCDPQKVHQYLNWNLDELARATKATIDGAGHFPHVEKQRKTADAVLAFVAR